MPLINAAFAWSGRKSTVIVFLGRFTVNTPLTISTRCLLPSYRFVFVCSDDLGVRVLGLQDSINHLGLSFVLFFFLIFLGGGEGVKVQNL